MKMVVSYLNFVFFIEVKAKSKYRILNFVFQFAKKTKWHFGYTDCMPSKLIGFEKPAVGFYAEVNLRKQKWSISCSYNPKKSMLDQNIQAFVNVWMFNST